MSNIKENRHEREKHPSLMLGLGGTGSRAVGYVADLMVQNGQKFNSNNEKYAMAVIDTDQGDMDKLKACGREIPIIATGGGAKKVAAYLKDFPQAKEWIPESRELYYNRDNSKGAGQMRMLSRLSFLDTYNDHKRIKPLTDVINDLLTASTSPDEVFTVTIVCSLAGGTGSGMFIQTALWLRKYLMENFNRSCVINGIFLMPDVFIEMGKITKEAEIKKVQANAYAALRELNSITNIRKGDSKPIERLVIDDLFDSNDYLEDNGGENFSGIPVYNRVYFVGSTREKSGRLESMVAYEKVVARLAYENLFSPIATAITSGDDNSEAQQIVADDPVYYSAGIAKVEYPAENMLDYLSLRMAKESIGNGMQSIDIEMDEDENRIFEQSLRGIESLTVYDRKEQYIKKYEKNIENSVGAPSSYFSGLKDQSFYKISTKIEGVEEPRLERIDKIETYLTRLTECYLSEYALAVHPGGIDQLPVGKNSMEENAWLKEKQRSEKLKEEYNKRIFIFESFERQVNESSIGSYVEEILDKIFPNKMEYVKSVSDITCSDGDIDSIYSLMRVSDKGDGEARFADPVTVRYMLYRLFAECKKKEESYKTMRDSAKEEFEQKKNAFIKCPDDPDSKKVETIDYLGNKIDKFKRRFLRMLNSAVGACEEYADAAIKYHVLQAMGTRLFYLIKEVENFFEALNDIKIDLDSALLHAEKELENTPNAIYVGVSAATRDAMYHKLVKLEEQKKMQSGKPVNKAIFDSIYGLFCAKMTKASEENKKYADLDIKESFIRTTTDYYKKIATEDRLFKVDMDVFAAIRMEAMANGKSYESYVRELQETLLLKSAVFINTKGGAGEKVSVWGLNNKVSISQDDLSAWTGIDLNTNATPFYSPTEWTCYTYRSGFRLNDLKDFDEQKRGKYYECYTEIVERILKDVEEQKREEPLIEIPHLDKNWANQLPFISSDIQSRKEENFYRLFWIAVAYTYLRADKGSKGGNIYYIGHREPNKNGWEDMEKKKYVLTADKREIPLRSIVSLINVLKTNATFLREAAACESLFEADLRLVKRTNTYVNTLFIKGLLHNPEMGLKEIMNRYESDAEKNEDEYLALKKAYEDLIEKFVAVRHADAAVEDEISRDEAEMMEGKRQNVVRRLIDLIKEGKTDEEIERDIEQEETDNE